ncbi:MAG: aminotransferase class III-fold pyridoxal phosphate-dependent enzyme, partial [candidate division Zixibacteria bacterium]
MKDGHVANRPVISIAKASSIAQEHWSLTGELAEMPSERDRNFRLTTPDGSTFVLKVTNSSQDRAHLELQNLMMQHLFDHDLGNGCPHAIESVNGDQIDEAEDDDGQNCLVRMLTYVPGTTVGSLKYHTPELLSGLGRFVGRVTKGMDGFVHPAAECEMYWDLACVQKTIDDRIDMMTDREHRNLVEHYLKLHADQVLPKLSKLRRSVIHNDPNDHNLITSIVSTQDRNRTREVTGLIDFGDVMLSHTVNEPATAIAYAMLKKEAPLSAAAQVLAGYHRIFPLEENEIEAVYLLAILRICMSVTLSTFQQVQSPENKYLLISQKPGWVLLEQARSIDHGFAQMTMRKACGFEPEVSRSVPLLNDLRDEKSGEDYTTELKLARSSLIGRSLCLSYDEPLHIVRGYRQYLYDSDGRAYLDTVNNIAHVGHCHPHVVEAISRQAGLLNTNTRYLHENMVEYARRLTATLPEKLSVCYFVCSGSEANELALRMARVHTGSDQFIVVDNAYHGNTTSLIEISPYKFRSSGSARAPDHVHVVPMPDRYRGLYREDETDISAQYASHVGLAIERMQTRDLKPAAFICESILSCGGQIVLPDNYLDLAYSFVHEAGGLCIADEVQVGLGRVGSNFWAFELQNVVPDIVTIGKPIGNGHPLAAVVTTPEIAASFDNGMEYFNSFGGNPVSCAAGMAVLDVLETELLQQSAKDVGSYFKSELICLEKQFPAIGDVRGVGLFIGIEFVEEGDRRLPAEQFARFVSEQMKSVLVL